MDKNTKKTWNKKTSGSVLVLESFPLHYISVRPLKGKVNASGVDTEGKEKEEVTTDSFAKLAQSEREE